MLTYGDPFNTPFQEWFPALTGRNNLTAVQGYEWLPGGVFSRRIDDFNSLQTCLTGSLACVEAWAADRQIDYDYLLVHHGFVGMVEGTTTGARVNQWISAELNQSTDFRRVYHSEWIEIFERMANTAIHSP